MLAVNALRAVANNACCCVLLQTITAFNLPEIQGSGLTGRYSV
jgi:hypothetical protein